MVVLLEHFHSSHSIIVLIQPQWLLREHFHLIGLGSDAVDEMGQQVFDEFHLLPQDGSLFDRLSFLKDICDKNNQPYSICLALEWI